MHKTVLHVGISVKFLATLEEEQHIFAQTVLPHFPEAEMIPSVMPFILGNLVVSSFLVDSENYYSRAVTMEDSLDMSQVTIWFSDLADVLDIHSGLRKARSGL
jgi:hypothetical protein